MMDAAAVKEEEEEDLSGVEVLPASTKSRIVTAMVPQCSVQEVEELQRAVLRIFEEEKERMEKHAFQVMPQVVSKYVCSVCGNRTQELFLTDGRSGDVICLGTDGRGCGAVAEDHKMHEGTAFRTFEGEEDKNHHGPAPNKLYSASHNMRTNLAAVPGVPGSQSKASKLRQTAEQVELGLSNLGKDERRTREGYKDAQKKKAFDLIAHAANNVGLHKDVADRANELFAAYRDSKEAVHRFHVVVCACVLQAAADNARDEARQRRRLQAEPQQPLLQSRRSLLLQKPLAVIHRQRDEVLSSEQGGTHRAGIAPSTTSTTSQTTGRKRPRGADEKPNGLKTAKNAPPHKTVRAGKAWALTLRDLPPLPDGDDD